MSPAFEVGRSHDRGAAGAAPPFLGRAAELGWFKSRLTATLDGRPRVGILVGEPGIGKTRLLREFQGIAATHGAAICAGRGHEDLALPFLPIADALGPLVRSMPARLARTLGVDGERMRRLVRGDVDPGAPVPGRPWATDDPALFLAASRTVVELACARPLVLVLDDLHWIDQSSLELLAHLLFTVADRGAHERIPLLVVAATRPVDASHRLARMLARVGRDDVCEPLALAGLDELAIAELVQGLGIPHPSHQMIAVVQDATRGNPLFVQEVVHHLLRQGALAERGGTLMATMAAADLRLPDDVVSAIAARIDELDQRQRHVLTLAACLGERVAPDTLVAVAAAGSAETRRLLDEACARGFLTADRDYQFVHPLVRHSFYVRPTAEERSRLHARIAEVLHSLHPEPTADQTLEIAHHMIAAGRLVDPAALVEIARRAGHVAFARASWTEAARLFAAALDATASPLTTAERAELHCLAGLSHYRDQDGGPCLDQYERAIAAFREVGDLRGLARALMGRTRAQFTLASVPYGTLLDTAPLLDVAERLEGMDPVMAGFVRAELAQVYWTARQPADATAMGELALEIGRREGNDVLAAEAHRALALSAGQRMDPLGGVEHLEAGLAAARRAADTWLESQLHQRLPLALHVCGRLDEARRMAASGAALTRALHDWGDRSLSEGASVCIAVARGEFEAAERHARQTLQLIQRSGYPWAGPTALPALACAHTLRGAWADADRALAMLITPGAVFQDPGPVVHISSWVLRQVVRAWSDDSPTLRDELRERIAPIARTVAADGADDVHAVGVFAAFVDLAERLNDPAMAEIAYEALVRAAERRVVLSSGWVSLIARALGSAATVLRRWERAEAWFVTAIEQARAGHLRPELGRALFGQARLLLGRGRAGDRPRARALLDEAQRIFRTLGMAPCLADAAALAGGLPPTTVTASAPDPLRLTRREQTILRHVVAGRSDHDVARDLVLDPAIVARTVRALLRKLGAETRTELGPRAVARGLLTNIAEATEPQPLVTILFTDVVGSTPLFERLGDAAARAVLRAHDTIVRGAVRACGGTERKHTGDGMMASFPSVGQALRCAIAIQRDIAAWGESEPARRIAVRVGLNAGEPVSEAGDLFGATVNAAARICQHARPGQILVSEVVWRLAEGLSLTFAEHARVRLRGFARRHRLFELVW